MATPTTEIVFLPALDIVRLEDADNESGQKLLKLLADLKPKYAAVLWSRSVDKEDIIGICVEHLPDGGKPFPVSSLAPFEASPSRTLLVRAKATDFPANPVTEVAILPTPQTASEVRLAELSNASQKFGAAMLAAPAPVGYDGKMALTYKSSWAAGPPENRLIMMIGWREVPNHLAAMETTVFRDNLKTIFSAIAEETGVEDEFMAVAGTLDVTHFKWKAL